MARAARWPAAERVCRAEIDAIFRLTAPRGRCWLPGCGRNRGALHRSACESQISHPSATAGSCDDAAAAAARQAKSFAFIEAARKTDDDCRVLVHCAAGKSRSATVVTHYVMRRFQWPLRRAFAHVKARRCWLARPNITRQPQPSAPATRWLMRCDLLSHPLFLRSPPSAQVCRPLVAPNIAFGLQLERAEATALRSGELLGSPSVVGLTAWAGLLSNPAGSLRQYHSTLHNPL